MRSRPLGRRSYLALIAVGTVTAGLGTALTVRNTSASQVSARPPHETQICALGRG